VSSLGAAQKTRLLGGRKMEVLAVAGSSENQGRWLGPSLERQQPTPRMAQLTGLGLRRQNVPHAVKDENQNTAAK
jgi:hypothetical protein